MMRILDERNSGKAKEGNHPVSCTDVRGQEGKEIFFVPYGLVLEGYHLF